MDPPPGTQDMNTVPEWTRLKLDESAFTWTGNKLPASLGPKARHTLKRQSNKEQEKEKSKVKQVFKS